MAYIVGSTTTYNYGSVTSPYPYEATNTNSENCGAFSFTLVASSEIQSIVTVSALSANQVKFKIEAADKSLAGSYTDLKLQIGLLDWPAISIAETLAWSLDVYALTN